MLGDVPSVVNGQVLGTSGKSYRIEGMTISLDDTAENVLQGDLSYRLHVQNIGWQDWKTEGEYAGTRGKSLRVEALQMKLTGEAEKRYNLYYRAHVQDFGWMGWASSGEKAGSEKYSKRMEAVQIVLIPKSQEQKGYQNSGVAFRERYMYQNPSQYLQIKHKQKVLYGGGYNLSEGYMGVKVLWAQRALGLERTRAIMDTDTMLAVRKFQESRQLPVTGIVDFATWKAMGYTAEEWTGLGTYVSKLKTNSSSTKSQCIEAMISTAYEYLGTKYVIGAAGAPGTGIDCSGLAMQALYSAGIDPEPVNPIRHSRPGYEYESRNMWNLPMKKVSYSQRQRGDLIFYSNSRGVIIHVAIYLGNDQVIEAWPDKVVVWPIKNSHRSIIKGVMRPSCKVEYTILSLQTIGRNSLMSEDFFDSDIVRICLNYLIA